MKTKKRRDPETWLEGVVGNYCRMAERAPTGGSRIALRAAAAELLPEDERTPVGPDCLCANCWAYRSRLSRHEVRGDA